MAVSLSIYYFTCLKGLQKHTLKLVVTERRANVVLA